MFTPASITALIIASSFAAGLNIYATVFTLGILNRTHLVQLPPGLSPLTNTWVLVISAILFFVEFFADKLPALDLFWNILHTFIRVPVAALVAYQASSQLSPQMQILATALGAAIALATHTSKTAVRAAVTPTPEPISNIALSTTEDVVAVSITWFATHHPIIAASIALALLVTIILAARALLKAIHRPLQKIFRPDLNPPGSP
jgi:Domain of unknown function (DUF4126)